MTDQDRMLEAALDWIENGIDASRESEAILRGDAGVRGSPTEKAQKVLSKARTAIMISRERK